MEDFSRIIQHQLLTEASPHHLRQLQHIVQQFSTAPGQVINLQKSVIFFSTNVTPSTRNRIANIMQMKIMGLGEKYLGIPLLLHRSKTKNCRPILDNMNIILQGWVLKLPDAKIQQMDQIQRNYWWGKKKHFIGWYKHEPPPPCENTSWIWQSILDGLQIIYRFGKWKIGNGTTVNIWKHNWIPCEQEPLYKWNDLNINELQWVSDLIHFETREWNVTLLRKLFSPQQVDSILTIPLMLHTQDTLIWPLTSTGIFTVKSTYNHLCEIDLHDTNLSSFSTTFWLKFWKLKIPYKLLIFLCKIIHDALPVRSNLRHVPDIIDFSCPLCNIGHIEHINHLFFTRPFATAIWKASLPQHFHLLQQYNTISDWIYTWSSTNVVFNFYLDSPSIHGILATMWHIWTYRCQVIFQQAQININSVLLPLFKHLTNIASSLVSNQHAFHPRHIVGHSHHRNPPPPDTLKMNVDASYHKSFYLSGIAVIVRTSTGQHVASRGVLKRVENAFQAETWALLQAMQLAKAKDWDVVIFESDNKSLMLYMNNGFPLPPWESSTILSLCVDLCKIHQNWKCVYVPRVCNKAADCLAKSVRKYFNVEEWWNIPPAEISISLDKDVSIT
ncbi:uncharacterized protein LOC113291550 [Papaver somniferum]|uniref:uncharacterized protein LOC113291550 n=1 Tax=Papaver somniferum TaxID=3469 RepID=UPI000E702CD8|nr:uncharacterized protein LOC113291550 [Papaver somniferum]